MRILVLLGLAALVYYGRSAVTAVSSGVVELMAAAIKSFEGWAPGTRSYRNNNPGNLKLSNPPQAGATGADDEGHAIFPTYDDGWQALLRQLRAAFAGTSLYYFPTMTLYQFFSKWATGNAGPYAEFVAGQLGVEPTSRLIDL